MKKRLLLLFTVLCALVITFTFFGCDEEPTIITSSNYEVKVVLRECEGMTITSDNSKTVKSGKDTYFEIEIDDDYIYLGNTANASFNERNGRLSVMHVLYPQTIDVILVPKSEMLQLTVENDRGLTRITEGSEWWAEPGVATVVASGYAGDMFIGWSLNNYIEDGGTLLSTELEYTFYMNKTTKLYANFVNLSEYEIIYHANGGTVKGSEDDTYTFTGKFSEMFSMQQTLESNGTFEREGYVAVGYSTEPANYEDYATVNDIPGFSNMGGVCQVGETAKLDLYVVWAKATDESKFTFSNGAITGYKGTDRVVIIPEKIGGKEVQKINTGVFTGNITRVVIPKTVTSVAEKAFSNCAALSEVVFFDSLTEVYNSSFNSCPRISTICLNAQRLPKYSGTAEGSFCIKYERVRTATQPKIVVVSGSSTLNGLVSDVMEENFPGYTVVNYGTNAQNSSTFFLDVISNYVNEGDLIIHAPEFTAGNPMGGNAIQPKLFRANEQCYDIFREVDMTKYTDFWDSWRKFLNGDPSDSSLTPALNLASKKYQLTNTGMNKYGDLANSRPGPTKDSFGGATTKFNYNLLKYNNLNRVNKQITENGGTLLMSFGTFDLARMNPSQTNQEEYDKFTADCQSKLDYPVISNVGTYIMEHALFHNSEWHCSYEGALIRTENLTADLRKYLASVGK